MTNGCGRLVTYVAHPQPLGYLLRQHLHPRPPRIDPRHPSIPPNQMESQEAHLAEYQQTVPADSQLVGGMQDWGKSTNSIKENIGSYCSLLFPILFPTEPKDIDEAATHENEMLAATREEDTNRMHWYCILVQHFSRRYIVHGVMADLELSIRFGQQSVATTPTGNIGREQTLLC